MQCSTVAHSLALMAGGRQGKLIDKKANNAWPLPFLRTSVWYLDFKTT